MIQTTIALNMKRRPNRGQAFTFDISAYDKLTSEPWLAQMIDEVRGGNESVKGELPFRCAHYGGFKDNHRSQKDALPETFLFQTNVDVDDKDIVDVALERAMALDKEKKSTWHGMLLHAEYSARKKLHLDIRMPIGMTIEETQREYCKMLDIPYDEGCITPERFIYVTDKRQEIYRSEMWYAVLPDDELAARRKAFEDRGLTIDGRLREGDKSHNDPIKSSLPASEGDHKTPPLGEDGRGLYLGIPYSLIISKYWEMFYNGMTPVVSNRDTLTYELANVMKHICGYDRNVLAKVIPCYDGFPEGEKMKCIDSALSGKRTQMPKRLRDVLEALRSEMLIKDGNSSITELDDAIAQDELFFYNRIPKSVLVQGIKDSIDAAGQQLSIPVITAICPAIGARATGVKLDVHGKPNTLNLISYISGDFGSGKGQMDDVVYAWMSEDIAMAEMYNQQWAEWAQKKKAACNKKEQPVEPKLPKEWLTLNNTTANLAEELQNVQGRHAFSFTPEADVVSTKWKSTVSDFSTMIRQSYDASSYDREARSVDAVNVHIPHLLWNVVMCGTPDALYRVVSNYTDGFQSRIAVARTPDNTFTPLEDNPAHLTSVQKERIEQVSHLLPLLNGTIVLPKLEARGRQWLEEIRLETMKNFDRVMARQRFRVCVTAQRMICCLMLVAVCAKLIKEHGVNGAEALLKKNPELWKKMILKMQTPAFMDMFDIIADSLIDNAMYFFRDRIEAAFASRSYAGSKKQSGLRSRKGKNDTIFSRLPQEFSTTEASQHSIAIKGIGVTDNAVHQMLKNWQKQGLVEMLDNGNFRKMA